MILEDFSNMDDSRHTGLDYTRQDLSDESGLASFLEDLLEIIRTERSGDVATYIPQVSLRARSSLIFRLSPHPPGHILPPHSWPKSTLISAALLCVRTGEASTKSAIVMWTSRFKAVPNRSHVIIPSLTLPCLCRVHVSCVSRAAALVLTCSTWLVQTALPTKHEAGTRSTPMSAMSRAARRSTLSFSTRTGCLTTRASTRAP